jgi:S-adenosylmethionine decarboxylase
MIHAPTVERTGFGMHLMLDLRECDADRLSDLDAVFKLLDTLPEILGMTKVTAPYVFRYCGKVPEDKGITGFVVIAESHVSGHTFQEKGYAFADVFSCKPFDFDKAAAAIARSLGSLNVVTQTTHRGAGFPRSEDVL